MPIYEYICKSCEEDFEVLVFGNKKVVCPKCNSEKIIKKISSFAIKGVQKGNSACSSCKSSSCSTCK
jgi:putative FmdB family regulatory protein